MYSGDLDAGLFGEGQRGGRVGVLERATGLGTVVEEVVESVEWGLPTGVGIGGGRVYSIT